MTEGLAEDPSAHLAWCRARALEYVDGEEPEQAFASMCSDVLKHPHTASRFTVKNSRAGLRACQEGRDALRSWIESFR